MGGRGDRGMYQQMSVETLNVAENSCSVVAHDFLNELAY